jgi:putative phage-type endonuclease
MNAREEWLEERRRGVGGSDAAAALGQSRHKTAFQLFQEKRGNYTDTVMPEGAERMRFGQRMEQVIADEYAERYGVKLRRHHRLHQHTKYSWMLASYDRTIDGKREGLECKNVDAMSYRFGEWGDEYSDQVPVEHLFQCIHYLSVSGFDAWNLAACIGGNRLAIYRIERDEEMIEMVESGEADFWKHVQQDDPPPLDYTHASAVPMLRKLYPDTDGTTIHLPSEAEALHYARLDFTEQAALMEKGAEAAKARLLHMMAGASVALLPNGGGYTRKLVERKGYEVETTKYIDFRFSAKKGVSA